jgi:hypothetical protein
MASTHATVLFDQADDPDVLFSNGELQTVALTTATATIGFRSDINCAERFALWLEDCAALIRSEAELAERAVAECDSEAARLDRQIWGD